MHFEHLKAWRGGLGRAQRLSPMHNLQCLALFLLLLVLLHDDDHDDDDDDGDHDDGDHDLVLGLVLILLLLGLLPLDSAAFFNYFLLVKNHKKS